MNPADIPTTDKERKQKEDRRDSRKLAKALRSNELKPIYVPTRKTQEDRQLIRIRVMLTKDIRRYKNRIKALLKYYGIPIPLCFKGKESNWSNNFFEWLKTIELEEPTGKYVLNKLIEQCERLRKEILEANREIRKLSRTESYRKHTDLLITIPGIGLFISMVFLTELESISRFKNINKLASYIGLVPRTSGSGDKDNVGDITPRAHKYIRTLLIEAAWMTICSDPALSLKFNELCQRMKKNRAIVIIAKKLLNRIRYVLKNEEPYVLAVIQ